MTSNPITTAELGAVIVGAADVLHALCRALQAAGVMPRDDLIAMLEAVIADQRRAEGEATKRTFIAEAVREGLLLWKNQPPDMRERLSVIIGDKRDDEPPDGAA